jgi:hypothetical protein
MTAGVYVHLQIPCGIIFSWSPVHTSMDDWRHVIATQIARHYDRLRAYRKPITVKQPGAEQCKVIEQSSDEIIAEVEGNGVEPQFDQRYRLKLETGAWKISRIYWKCDCLNGDCLHCDGRGICPYCRGRSSMPGRRRGLLERLLMRYEGTSEHDVHDCSLCKNSGHCLHCTGHGKCCSCVGSDLPGWIPRQLTY